MITQSCVEMLGLKTYFPSNFRLCMPNHAKVKSFGILADLNVDVFNVHCKVDFHVMPVGFGAYPLILGRPWLRKVREIQNWH